MIQKLPAAVRTLIDEDPSGDYRLDVLAARFHVSKGTLAQQFKAAYHVTLHQYVLERRLLKAALLLRDTDDKIRAIAGDCGFASEKHFMVLFKKRFAVSAGAYRKQHGEV